MKKILLLILVFVTIVIVSMKYVENRDYAAKEEKLYSVGFSKEQVDELMNADDDSKIEEAIANLQSEVDTKEDTVLNLLGLPLSFVKDDSLTLYEYNIKLSDFITTTQATYDAEIAKVDERMAKYNYIDETNYEGQSLDQIFSNKNNLIVNFEKELVNKVATLKADLVANGVRSEVVESYITGDYLTDISEMEKKLSYYKSFGSLTTMDGVSFAPGNMELLQILNDHRVSKGLAPYRYNAEGQACVDQEAIAYAKNKNPHNWLCKELISEGASLASVKSNYIQIAGNFLTTHASHEAGVTNPNWKSAACSVVNNGKMNYMICGYFPY